MKRLAEHTLERAVDYHVSNSLPIYENVFRPGTPLHFKLLERVKSLYDSQQYTPMNEDEEAILQTDIGSWDVSKVVNFFNMFNNATNFNNGNSDSIKNWLLKISGPVNLSGMFQNADAFNQPLNWNTSAVTTMFAMFNGSNQFNQDIGSWSVSNVMSFGAMFQNATNFNRNLGSWQLNLSLSGFSLIFLLPFNPCLYFFKAFLGFNAET